MLVCNKLKLIVSGSLKMVRINWGISQEAMSERLNITPRAYSNLELGKSLCSTPTLLRFLALCCISDKIAEMMREIKAVFESEFESTDDAA